MQPDPSLLARFDAVPLREGKHPGPDQGMCVMEWVSQVAGETFSDHPRCVSPVWGNLFRVANDYLDPSARQRLKPYALRALGTSAQPAIELRVFLRLADWAIRTVLPRALEGLGWGDVRGAFWPLPPITGPAEAVAASRALLTVGRLIDAGGVRFAAPSPTLINELIDYGLCAAEEVPQALLAPSGPDYWGGRAVSMFGAACVLLHGQADTAPLPSTRATAYVTLAALHASLFTLLDELLPVPTADPAVAQVAALLAGWQAARFPVSVALHGVAVGG